MGKFQRIKYPDGQISAKWEVGQYDSNPLARRLVPVRQRINSYEDLFYVRAIADVLQAEPMLPVVSELFIPCMFGQRSDRRFDRFQSFDLKLIANIINECGFAKVKIFDPHSDVCLALIDNSEKVSAYDYVKKAVQDLYRPETGINTCNFMLVSPDAGAYKKVFEFGEKLNVPVTGAMKHRDGDGTIAISFTHDVKDMHCLIVDDLCDGGATFVSLAKLLKLHGAAKVYLYVSHGIFSKGLLALKQAGIEHIYTTNSVRDIPADRQVYSQLEIDFVTQYKVI